MFTLWLARLWTQWFGYRSHRAPQRRHRPLLEPLECRLTPSGNPPVATDDNFSITEDVVLTRNVITDNNGNGIDSDPEGDLLTISAARDSNNNIILLGFPTVLPSGATLTVNLNGGIVYDSSTSSTFNALDLGETANDTFTYTISDGTGTDSALVTITINGQNDAPTARPDSFNTNENTPVNGNVLNNNGSGADSDPEDDTLTVISATDLNNNAIPIGTPVTLPSGATLTINSNGTFNYDPTTSAQFNAMTTNDLDSDGFSYEISDGDVTDTASVTFAITGVNDPPVAADDNYLVDVNALLTGNVITNNNGQDSDPEGDTFTLTAATDSNNNSIPLGTPTLLPSGATLTINSNGSFSYLAFGNVGLGEGEFISDSFTYTISDGNGSDGASVNIDVYGVNDGPTATDNDYTTDEDTELTGNVITDDTGDGADSDPDTNDQLSIFFAVDENNQFITLGTPTTLPSGGVLTINEDGSFTYDASAFNSLAVGESVNDVFFYTVRDFASAFDGARVDITIEGRNDAPDATNNSYTVDEDDSITGNVLTDGTDDSDPDTSDTLSVSAAANSNNASIPLGTPTVLPSGATLTINANGSFLYDANTSAAFDNLPLGGSTTDSFTYTISDGNGGSDTATVSLTVTRELDLEVTVSESSNVVLAGLGHGNLIYTVKVENVGNKNLTGIVLSEDLTLPTGTFVLLVVPSKGSFSTTTEPDGIWNLGSLNVGDTATLTIMLTAGSSTADGATIGTMSLVTATTQADIDSTTAAESSSVVRRVDLKVTAASSGALVSPNVSNLTQIITVKNNGPSDASGVVLSQDLTLPTGVSVVSVTPSQGTFTLSTAPDGTWTVGNLAAGESATLTIVYSANGSAVQGTTVSNTATVTTSNETRVNTSDDTVTHSANVKRATDLKVAHKGNLTAVKVGKAVIFTITLTNVGPSTATGVQLTNTLPSGLNFVSATPSAGTFANGIWDVGTLAVGAKVTLRIRATATGSVMGQVFANAEVTALDQFDPLLLNNKKTAKVKIVP